MPNALLHYQRGGVSAIFLTKTFLRHSFRRFVIFIITKYLMFENSLFIFLLYIFRLLQDTTNVYRYFFVRDARRRGRHKSDTTISLTIVPLVEQPTRFLRTATYQKVRPVRNNLQRTKAVGADDVFPARLTSLSKQRKNIICPHGVLPHRCKPKYILRKQPGG